MPATTTLLAFALAAFVLIVVPGPNLIYILARGVEQGRSAAVASAFGVETGSLFHIAAAAAGLSALLASSQLAFDIVRYLGAAYLVYLGIRTLLQRDEHTAAVAPSDGRRLWHAYRQGVLVNVLNPKVALFFLAFLPQFIDPMRGQAATQILALGIIFFAIALAMDILYAMASGSVGSFLRRRPQYLRWQRYLTGSVYIGLGMAAAVTGRNRG